MTLPQEIGLTLGLLALGVAGVYAWRRIPILQCPNCAKYLIEEDIKLEVVGDEQGDREYATCPSCGHQWRLEKVGER